MKIWVHVLGAVTCVASGCLLVYDYDDYVEGGGTGGTGNGVTASIGGGAGGLPDACDVCTAQAQDGACSEAWQGCTDLPDCVALYQCAADCADAACVAACAAQRPEVVPVFYAAAHCLSCQECATDCALCASLGCVDGMLSGMETEQDCGGPDCSPCNIGAPCSTREDCGGGFCVDGFCCNQGCDGLCEACSMEFTGLADGACAPIPTGQDPGLECNDADMCNGAGKCRCMDGIANGDEDAVDCGNQSVCGACPYHWVCNAGGCTSNAQVAGMCCNSVMDCSNCLDQTSQCQATHGKGCTQLGAMQYFFSGTSVPNDCSNTPGLSACLYFDCVCT